MNPYTAESARSLNYKSRRIQRLARDQSPEVLRFWAKVADALSVYPPQASERLIRMIQDYDSYARGAWWELYLYWQLQKSSDSVVVEHLVTPTMKSVDFMATYQGRRVLLEATSIGYKLSRAVQDVEIEVMGLFDDLDCRHDLICVYITKASPEFPNLEKLRTELIVWNQHSESRKTFDWIDATAGWELSARRRDLNGTHACSGKSGCLLTPFEVSDFTDEQNGPQDLVTQLRESVDRKRRKVTESDSADYVIAIAHESPFASDGLFTQFATLFGRPGIEVHLESGTTTEVLTDQGSFFDSEDGALVAAVLFGTGYVFGFTDAHLPTLWLNPHHTPGLNAAVFPLEVAVIRVNSGHLERLESNRGDAEWIPISIY